MALLSLLVVFLTSFAVGVVCLLAIQKKALIDFKTIVFAIPIGILLYSVAVFTLSYLVGFRNSVASSVIIFPLAILLLVVFLKMKVGLNLTRGFHVIIVPLVVVFGLSLWGLFTTHIIPEGDPGNLLTGESTYGDLPFHLTTISQTAFGEVFPPENPFFSGLKLVYPFFINIFSSALVVLGVGLRTSIIWPGMVLGIITVVLLYIFSYRFCRDKAVAVLSTILFLLHGGLGFFYFFKDIGSGEYQLPFWQNPRPYPDYTHVFGENIQWANYLTRIIVPERSVLLGIPLGLIILYLLFSAKAKRNIKMSILAGVLTGLLPFSHTHTFLVFAIVIPFLALFELKEVKVSRWLWHWLLFGLAAFVVSAPQLLAILGHVGESSFFKVRLGWMSKPGILGFVIFWWKNTGLLIPLMLTALIIKKTPVMVKRFVLVSFIIFGLINIFQFQPYDWDNVKFMFWFGVFGAMAASFVLVEIWRKGFFGKAFSVLICTSLILSACLSLFRELIVQNQLFGRDEIELGSWVRNNTSSESIFLTAPIHNSFVNNLGGRRIYMGYPGLLWVHGIDYSDKEVFLKKAYRGEVSAEQMKEQGIDYVVVSDYEKNNLEVEEGIISSRYCLVTSNSGFKIYSINNINCSSF